MITEATGLLRQRPTRPLPGQLRRACNRKTPAPNHAENNTQHTTRTDEPEHNTTNLDTETRRNLRAPGHYSRDRAKLDDQALGELLCPMTRVVDPSSNDAPAA
jgi:hypothetical protein